jgi:hypothetical protein
MTDLSTILTVGMPTLAVLVGILVNNARLTDLRVYIDSKFADVNRRFDDVNRRFDSVEKRLDRIEAILERHETRITILEERTNPLRTIR